MAYKLSILVPSRNEEFLGNTIDDVLSKTGDETEIIAVLDGCWPVKPLPQHPRLTLIHNAVSIGQRAAVNLAASASRADFVCKMDAHVSVGEGFGEKMIADCGPYDTLIPRMYNLHVFDLKCMKCGHRTYQGPKLTHCTNCNQDAEHEKFMVWTPRWGRMTDFTRFDANLHFKYWGDYKKRPEAVGDVVEVMGCLGACWMMRRERFWEIDGMDTSCGSWGQMGVEVSAKSTLDGKGRQIVTRNTYFSHLFRTSAGFSFPYPLAHSQTEHARNYSQAFWREGKWDKAVHPLSWLVSKYWPVPGWTDQDLDALKASESGRKQFAPAQVVERQGKDKYVKSAPETGLTKGIVYFTENRCPEPFFTAAQKQLQRATNGHQLVSVSLKPIDFGDNIVLGMERGYVTMFNQILAGLSHLETDFAFLCEHDCLYPPEHFAFTPPRNDVYYYDENIWRLDAFTGHAWFHYHRSVSGLVADRRLLIDHYRERLARIAKEGFSYRNGFEAGCRSTRHGGYDDFKALSFFSEVPYIDLRHDKNLTKTLRKPEDYRNAKYTAGWTESDRVPGWAVTEGRMPEFIEDVKEGRISP